MQPAPSRISEHVAGPLLPTLKSARATMQVLATLHSVGRYSHCDMNHTVIASHDITSIDSINTCFVCKLKQTCSCKYILRSQKHVEILLNHNNQSRRGCRCMRVNCGVGMAQFKRQMTSKSRYSVTKWYMKSHVKSRMSLNYTSSPYRAVNTPPFGHKNHSVSAV